MKVPYVIVPVISLCFSSISTIPWLCKQPQSKILCPLAFWKGYTLQWKVQIENWSVEAGQNQCGGFSLAQH